MPEFDRYHDAAPGGLYAQQQGNVEAPRDSFIMPLVSATKQLDEMVSRLSMIADRLCGASPPSTAGTAQHAKLSTSSGAGMFTELSMLGNGMHAKIGEGFDALARIERMLP